MKFEYERSKLKFDVEIWSWNKGAKIEVRIWGWNLKLKFEVEILSGYMKSEKKLQLGDEISWEM